jgi:hypothetical protein
MVAFDIARVHFTGSYACPRGRRCRSETGQRAKERRPDSGDSQSESLLFLAAAIPLLGSITFV